ncbi:hypothetical protein C8R46DRAFT_1030328 [Mycena filopes]|nr:hypothetical protein C8R46DRAFT_1030328 [Mycena filopes]
MFMPVAPQSIDTQVFISFGSHPEREPDIQQQGMQVIPNVLGATNTMIATPFAEASPLAPFACDPTSALGCFASHTLPLLALSLTLVLLVVIPVLVYFERRKVAAWIEARKRAGLPTDPESIAIEMRNLQRMRAPRDAEVYM